MRDRTLVLKQVPLKQGLKRSILLPVSAVAISSKASSIKTRIETFLQYSLFYRSFCSKASSIKTRIETPNQPYHVFLHYSSKASSIKTRIETLHIHKMRIVIRVLKQVPLKQGLKHKIKEISIEYEEVLKQVPLKQGLKP